MVAVATKRRFSVDDYYRMGEAGILGPDDRVELLDGEVFDMSPIGVPHAGCVRFLVGWFTTRLSGRAQVDAQNPVRLSPYSEPQPDVVLLRPRSDLYRTAHPSPGDVLLLIEVADTTLVYDREVKLPLYAAAGIPETWIVDLPGRRVLVFRRPAGGAYQDQSVCEGDGALVPTAFPDLALPCAEVVA